MNQQKATQDAYDRALGVALQRRIALLAPIRLDVGRLELRAEARSGIAGCSVADEELAARLQELSAITPDDAAVGHARVMIDILSDDAVTTTHPSMLVPSFIDNQIRSVSTITPGTIYESTTLTETDLLTLAGRFHELYRKFVDSRRTVLDLPFPE